MQVKSRGIARVVGHQTIEHTASEIGDVLAVTALAQAAVVLVGREVGVEIEKQKIQKENIKISM